MRQFLWGALTLSSVIATMFFVHYWRLSRDRLYVFFAVAFAAMALNWVGLAIADPHMETRHHIYLLRLLAFVLIIAGIVDKNRRGSPS
jgi:hypothetical protein